MVWTGLELYYTPGSPNCRAVLMCIKALGIEGVDLIKLDMYQKYEHKKPWFVKVSVNHNFDICPSEAMKYLISPIFSWPWACRFPSALKNIEFRPEARVS